MKLTELQERAITEIAKRTNIILQAKPGSGKTRVVLEAFIRERGNHAIYCSTPQIAYKSVPSEAKKFKYQIPLYSFEDNETRAAALKTWKINGGILLISIHILHKLPLVHVPPTAWFILDESTMVKRPGGTWSEMAQRVAAACEKRVLMTGTFRSNDLHQVYKQAAIAIGDQNEIVSKLGRFETWKRKHFYVQTLRRGMFMYDKLLPKPKALKNIVKELEGLLVVLDQDEETLKRYPKVVEEQITVSADIPKQFLYRTINENSGVIRLQQAAFGVVYLDKIDKEKHRRTLKLHSAKLKIIEELFKKHKRVVYVYTFDHERSLVGRIANKIGLKTRCTARRSKNWINDWNEGKIDILLLHPRSAGHGVNIQFGGSVMIWGIPTPDYEAYTQTVARLARPGQPSDRVLVYEIVCEGTIDTIMKRARETRLSGEAELLEKWKAVTRTAVRATDQQGGEQ